MPDRSRSVDDPGMDLDNLGRAYLSALAWRDWRASDRHLLRLRTNLGVILTLLGWRPDDTGAGPPPGPKAGS